MRATLASTYRSLLHNLQNNQNRLEELRLQGATGKKMLKPSDDPSGIRPVLNARGQIRSAERYLRTMGTAMDRLNTMDSVMTQMENLMVRGKETLVAAGSGALSSQDLRTYADQIRNIKEELLALGNTQIDGKYIFSGHSESTMPFRPMGLGDPDYDPEVNPQPIIYAGDGAEVKLEIGPGAMVTVNLTGDALFMGGSGDIFKILDDIERALREEDSAGALAQMDAFDNAADHMRTLRSQKGNIAQRIDNSMLNMQDMRIDMMEMLSRYEDADILETLTNLTAQETAFKAALEITSQVSRLSILDYMRR